MRTRTLLLLAVSCGLAILLAGGVLMWQLSHQTLKDAKRTGDQGVAGAAVVRVDDFSESAGVLTVTVTLSGVDAPDGLKGFTLVGVPRPVAPLPAAGNSDACTGFTIEAVTCTLLFPTDEFTTQDRQLLFIRAEEQVRWSLV